MSKKRTPRRHDLNRRQERMARQLIIHGKRQEHDADFLGGIHRPITMSEPDMVRGYEWARTHACRWWVRASIYCRGDNGADYRQDVEAEMQQACRVNELGEWRLSLLDQARASVNPRHIVAEGFEMGVI